MLIEVIISIWNWYDFTQNTWTAVLHDILCLVWKVNLIWSQTCFTMDSLNEDVVSSVIPISECVLRKEGLYLNPFTYFWHNCIKRYKWFILCNNEDDIVSASFNKQIKYYKGRIERSFKPWLKPHQQRITGFLNCNNWLNSNDCMNKITLQVLHHTQPVWLTGFMWSIISRCYYEVGNSRRLLGESNHLLRLSMLDQSRSNAL